MMIKTALVVALHAVVIIGVAVGTASPEKQAVASCAMLEPSNEWSITYPTDGLIAYGAVPHVGIKAADPTGRLFNYYYNDTIQGGVFASELTLERTTALTGGSSVWSTDAYGDVGQFYSAVVSDEALLERDDPFLTSSNEGNVDTIVESMGGDGVAFWVSIAGE